MLLPDTEFGRLFFYFRQPAFCQCFVVGFEAAADLLAASFNECVISAGLNDLVEVLLDALESVLLPRRGGYLRFFVHFSSVGLQL